MGFLPKQCHSVAWSRENHVGVVVEVFVGERDVAGVDSVGQTSVGIAIPDCLGTFRALLWTKSSLDPNGMHTRA